MNREKLKRVRMIKTSDMKVTELELKEMFKWVGERITTNGIDTEAVDWLFDEFEQAKPNEWEIASNDKQPRANKKALRLFGVMPMLLSIAKCFDDYLEDLDPKDDIEEFSEAVEMMKNIADDNSMFIRN